MKRYLLLFLFISGFSAAQTALEEKMEAAAQKYFQQYLPTLYKNKKSFTIYGIAVTPQTLKERTRMLGSLIEMKDTQTAYYLESHTMEELKRAQKSAATERKKLQSYFMEIRDMEDSGVILYYCVADVGGTLKNGKPNAAYYELALGESGELIINPREVFQ